MPNRSYASSSAGDATPQRRRLKEGKQSEWSRYRYLGIGIDRTVLRAVGRGMKYLYE